MTDVTTDPVQHWLNQQQAGLQPSLADLCALCEDRVRALVRPRLRQFPTVRRDCRTTEITNDTLLRLLRALRDVTPKTTLELTRFLAALIRRVLLDHLKAIRRRQLAAPIGDDPAWVEQGTDHPLDSELMVAFHEYVEDLPPDEKVLFDLLYYRGLTTRQAATILGLSPSTLKRRWVEARLAVSRAIGDDFQNS